VMKGCSWRAYAYATIDYPREAEEKV
jgi:hypothetical protein